MTAPRDAETPERSARNGSETPERVEERSAPRGSTPETTGQYVPVQNGQPISGWTKDGEPAATTPGMPMVDPSQGAPTDSITDEAGRVWPVAKAEDGRTYYVGYGHLLGINEETGEDFETAPHQGDTDGERTPPADDRDEDREPAAYAGVRHDEDERP